MSHTRPKCRKTRFGRKSGRCRGKVIYRDHREATVALHAIHVAAKHQQELGVPVTRLEKRIYSCDECAGLHITKNATWTARTPTITWPITIPQTT